MGLTGSGSDSQWLFKSLIFAMAIVVLLPTFMAIYLPANDSSIDRDELFDAYYEMTGQQAQTKTAIWVLTGLYTPVEEGQTWGVTEDGWMYRSELKSWTPSQYRGTPEQFSVTKGSDGVFRYAGNTEDYDAAAGRGHAQGDLYTMFSFDPLYKSDIFFTETNKTVTDGGFYYEYSGVRAAFQPISSYTTVNADGDRIPVIATSTSLSLVWYQWYTQSGVTGQLILSGNNGGVAFINGANIVSTFNSATSSATFPLVFNGGVNIDVTIKLDPLYLSTMTVQQCYDAGYWSILVTSQSADESAYVGTDNAFNPIKIFETMVNLFTFNYNDYNISGWMGMLCSLVFVLPLYATLITMAINNKELWLIIGVLGFIEFVETLDLFSLFG